MGGHASRLQLLPGCLLTCLCALTRCTRWLLPPAPWSLADLREGHLYHMTRATPGWGRVWAGGCRAPSPAHLVNLLQARLLLGQRFERRVLFALVQLCARRLLQERQDLRRLHVHDLWGARVDALARCRAAGWALGVRCAARRACRWACARSQPGWLAGCLPDRLASCPSWALGAMHVRLRTAAARRPTRLHPHCGCRLVLAPTFVTRPCMIRKCGLFTFSCTDWNMSATRLHSRVGRVISAARRAAGLPLPWGVQACYPAGAASAAAPTPGWRACR